MKAVVVLEYCGGSLGCVCWEAFLVVSIGARSGIGKGKGAWRRFGVGVEDGMYGDGCSVLGGNLMY